MASSSHGVASVPAVSPGDHPGAEPKLGSVANVASSNLAAQMAAHALAATRAAGLKSSVVFVPRPSASAAQVAQAREAGTVAPLYTGDPAPIGLAYYGLSGTGEGAPTGTILNTTAVRGIVDANSTGIQGMDLFQSSPDSYGIQLNAVMTNVTLLGTGHYSFWTQNVVEYYPATDFLVLVTNIWNFSGGGYSGHEFYSQSTSGQNDSTEYGALGYYYSELVVPYPITYPFVLTLTMNSGVTSGRDNMSFSVSLTNPDVPSEDFSASNWDSVVFNSIGGVHPTPLAPSGGSNYTANGLQYNAIGLTNDFELDLCGPGGGSQVDLSAADATFGLAYRLGSSFVAVPAAYSYGGETGETATGANVAWSNGAGGPGGLAEFGTVTTGPSILSGLWGTGAPEGSYAVKLAVSPANAFNFFQYNGTGTFATPLVLEPAYAPNMLTSTFYLMPGAYYLLTELADHTAKSSLVTVVASPQTVTISLPTNLAAGMYTPLWAFSNAEVASLAQAGAGTPSNPYVLYNNQLAPFSPAFGLYNDYTFPVFPGVFLFGTTTSVELYQPASFSAATNDFQFPGNELPQLNDLQYWFWDVTGASIVGAANISGWFGATAWYPLVFDSFNVVLYESDHNLIAGNNFDTESQALLMFSGGTIFGPLNVGGGNNTVWGNTFNEVNTPSGCPDSGHCVSLLSGVWGIGMQIAEDHDVIYNNAVNTPTTAWLLPMNLYSGTPFFYLHTAWNITPQPASIVHYAAGFPTLPLTGSIIGGTTQGGNFWWDYGITFNPYNGANNPYGVLPYDENAITLIVYVFGPAYYYFSYIYAGGDDAPLVPVAGPAVTFVEHGLLPGTAWGDNVSIGGLWYGFSTTSNYITLSVFAAPGHYAWAPVPPVGFTAHGGTFHLSDHPITVGVTFHLAAGYSYLTFHETGLPSGTEWSVTVNGTTPETYGFNVTLDTTTPSAKMVVLHGTYTFVASGAPGYFPSPSSGSLTIGGGTTVHVRYHIVTYALTFNETGIPAGKRWGVRITGPITGGPTRSATHYSTGASIGFTVPNGTYTYTILPPAHVTCTPPSGSQGISGAPASVGLVCVSTGGHLPANSNGTSIALLAATARLAVTRAPSA